MARIDNFNNFATDVADSIRSMTGKTGKIPASQFDTEIKSIETKEDLDEELNTYNTEVTEQGVSINTIMNLLEGKAAGSGGGKYAPKYILFRDYGGTELTEELANLDTSNLSKTDYMFYYATQLQSLNFDNFNFSNVTSMQYMLSDCENLESVSFKNVDTSNVVNMQYLFSTCYKLKELDLSYFNTSNVTNMTALFRGCKVLEKLDIRNFDFTKANHNSAMFTDVPVNCEIIVKDETAREWVLARRSDLTNVKTVAELEG